MEPTPVAGANHATLGTLATIVADKPGHEPVVVALHSSAAGARQWAPWRRLIAPDITLVTPELIGYDPDSGWSEHDGVTLDDEARRIARLLEAYPQGVHLVGHSYGGAVALRVALGWPERVRSLALYEPVLFALLRDDGDGNAWREITGVGHEIAALARAGRRSASAALFVDYWSGAGTWAALAPQRQQAVAARMPKVSAEFHALFGDRQPIEAYRRLRVPVRLAGGEHSPAPARRIVARLAQWLADTRVRWLSGLGHMGPLEDPLRVAAALGVPVAAAAALRAA